MNRESRTVRRPSVKQKIYKLLHLNHFHLPIIIAFRRILIP